MSCAAVLQVKACSPGVELASSRRGKTPTPDTMLIPKKNRKEVYKYLFKGEHTLLGARTKHRYHCADLRHI